MWARHLSIQLTHDTFQIKEGDHCVVWSASGGVAQRVIQIAKARNAVVIAVVRRSGMTLWEWICMRQVSSYSSAGG